VASFDRASGVVAKCAAFGCTALPAGRARNCRLEFGEINFAFQQTVLPHAREVLTNNWIPKTLLRPPPTEPND
jgi:hypothetical protein